LVCNPRIGQQAGEKNKDRAKNESGLEKNKTVASWTNIDITS
jgi:hypothetical protein